MNFWRRLFLFVSGCFLLAFNLYGQKTLDLSECLMMTLAASPGIEAERLSQQHETATLMQGKSTFLPQMDAFVNYHHFFNDFPTYLFPAQQGSILAGEPLTSPYALPLGLPHNLNTGLELSQTLFDANFFGRKQLTQGFYDYNTTKLKLAEEESLYKAATLFYQTAINMEKLAFIDLNLERLTRLQEIVKLQADQGFAKATDFEKLLVKTTNLRSSRNKLAAGIRQQIGYLKILMGLSQNEEISIIYDDDPLIKFSPDSLSADNNAELKMLGQQRNLHELQSRRIHADYYPKLQAYLGLLFQAQRENPNFLTQGQDWYNIHQWGLRLSIPIIRGFESRSKKEISQIVDRQLAFGSSQLQEQTRVAFFAAVDELESARYELKAQEENTILAEKVYRQSELGFSQGAVMLMDFLDSEATLREARMMYATAVLDMRLAELSILKITGNLKDLVTN